MVFSDSTRLPIYTIFSSLSSGEAACGCVSEEAHTVHPLKMLLSDFGQASNPTFHCVSYLDPCTWSVSEGISVCPYLSFTGYQA